MHRCSSITCEVTGERAARCVQRLNVAAHGRICADARRDRGRSGRGADGPDKHAARRYVQSHPGIGVVDYVIAATAMRLDADLWTRNTKHFPMFADLVAPY